MQRVLVVNKNKQPLMPCHPARARELLKKGRARVFRKYPFTIQIVEREGSNVQPVAFKVDPGSRTTGIVLVADFNRLKRVIWAAELTHRGQQIRDALLKRRRLRRSRRNRKLRYRPARFDNRRRPDGWLPPSLQSRIENTMTWVARLSRFVPITSISQELAKFDTALMQNGNLQGVEYQQGELYGYEVREYLLEKWERKCAYCGAANVRLEIEHIVPTSRGGSNRVSNLTLACNACNTAKSNQTAAEFGHPHIQAKAKQPLKDATAVNVTQWALYERLKLTGLSVEVGTGGRTKYNRITQGYPKAQWIDAACVGESGEGVLIHTHTQPLLIKAVGHGKRQRCRPDIYGFPLAHAPSRKTFQSFQTGDIVKAVIPKGKFAGVHIGRVAIRYRPSFRLNGFDVHPKYLTILHHSDGYSYEKGERHSPPA